MNENVKAFLEKVAEEPEWLEQHKDIEDKDEAIAAAVAKAAELGMPLTAEDFEAPQGELSENELAAVAGAGKCSCAVGGGGSADSSSDVCACVLVGCSDAMICMLLGFE